MTAEENTAIVATEPVQSLVSPEQAKAQWERFLALKAALLTPDDYQIIQGKSYSKKSGFRKIAVAFNLSDEIISETRTDRENGSFMWKIVVRVTAQNGRVCTGVAICDIEERKGGRTSWAHPEHDVYSTAHTRAKNRAISDMVAGGMVSAEEMAEVEPIQVAPPEPTRPKIPPKSDTPRTDARIARLSVSTLEESDVRGKAGGFK